ncbi:MAG TPA: beta-ketoacyl-[acyl-carrier-protein] synthase family protein, partial [Miltoncostaeaceae bacterium]|nr:beta-ketoacyl-[acyl-carrier-protein] synthase family protein [Miltoncostaeaceae bacterium]
MRRRVVITGLGVVAPLGVGVESFWDALTAGGSGARAVELDGVGVFPAFPADDGDAARERFGARDARRMDRVGRLAAVAGALALEDAGGLPVAADRAGVAIGCIHGGAATLDEAYRALLDRGADRVGPLTVPLSLVNSPAAATARVLGLRGPSSAVATACAAGADAIGGALEAIRAGRAEVMLAGGAEAALSPLVVAGYARMGALSRGHRAPDAASRPFDRGRDGFVIGEGAGILVLEERDHALARGARIHAELAGYGATCDAGHLTDPDPVGEGATRALRLAMADAGVAPAEVGYVNAHATSTPAGDVAEAHALRAAGLGDVPVSSTKSAHGHERLDAAGGAERVAVRGLGRRDGHIAETGGAQRVRLGHVARRGRGRVRVD